MIPQRLTREQGKVVNVIVNRQGLNLGKRGEKKEILDNGGTTFAFPSLCSSFVHVYI